MALTDITKKTSERRSQRLDEDYGRIIGRFEAGQSQIDISKELGIPPQTVNKAIQRWQKFGTTIPKKRTGRLPKLTETNKNDLRLNIRLEQRRHQIHNLEQLKVVLL